MSDDEQHEFRVAFINSRLIELKNGKDKLVEKIQGKYTNKNFYDLHKLNEQIVFNEKLLLLIDEGQEFYKLEN